MKNMLIAAVVTGLVVAGLVLYLIDGPATKGRLVNLEKWYPSYA